MESIREEIAKNLLYYRKKNKMTQKELASKLGVGNTTISNWENGVSSIDIDTLFQICEIFHIPIHAMYGKYQYLEQEYTETEREIIRRYREKAELQKAVRLLLGVTDEEKN